MADNGDQWWADVLKAYRQGDMPTAQALILQGLQKDPSLAVAGDRRYVTLANILILSAQWGLVNTLLPAGTNFFQSSGWLESVRLGVPVNQAGEALPWLTYPAIDFLDNRIRPNWRIFEWGCGSSTVWWSSRVSRIRSIESDEAWYQRVAASKPSNCTVELATAKDAYVGALDSGGLYDVLVIDGAWRNECAIAAADHAAKFIIYDNTDTEAYDPGVAALDSAGWQRIDFFGLMPAYAYKHCTSLFYKDPMLLQTDKRPAAMKLSAGQTCAHVLDETRRRMKSASGTERSVGP